MWPFKKDDNPIKVSDKKTWPKKGDSVIVNQKNDPWYGYRVIVTQINKKENWIGCKYQNDNRPIHISELSRFKDGYNKTFA